MKIDWKYLAMFFLAALSALIPLWQLNYDAEVHSLSGRTVSVSSLTSKVSAEVSGLKILVEGVEVKSPYLATIEIANDGTRPIRVEDFSVPVEVGIAKGASIIQAKIESTTPANLGATIDSNSDHVTVRPLLLNPDDRITLSVITSGNRPEFTFSARVAGIREISAEDTSKNTIGWMGAAISTVLAFMAFVLFSAFMDTVFENRPIHIGRVFAGFAALSSISLGIICATIVGGYFGWSSGGYGGIFFLTMGFYFAGLVFQSLAFKKSDAAG